MTTAVRKRERLQAVANGRGRDLPPGADPYMTREARAERVAWRRAHLAKWQADIERLGHYDPGHAYDIAHEYELDWTTDPDYGAEGVHWSEFDADGVHHPLDERAHAIKIRMCETARDRVGYRVASGGIYRFVEEIAVELKLCTAQGQPANSVKPDLIVMPSEADLDPARIPEDRQPRPDDPVPELILAILSESTASQDLDDKLHLYEMLGVREYMLYDLGGKRGVHSPRELILYRLEVGTYHRVPVEPELSEPEVPAYRSEVFDAPIRMLPDPRENDADMQDRPERRQPAPIFQWYDVQQGRWRDRASDEADRRKVGSGRKVEWRSVWSWLLTCCAGACPAPRRRRSARGSKSIGIPRDLRRMWWTACWMCNWHRTSGVPCSISHRTTSSTAVLPDGPPHAITFLGWAGRDRA